MKEPWRQVSGGRGLLLVAVALLALFMPNSAEAASRSQACRAVAPGVVAGEQRIALIMGNGAYRAEDSWQELPSVGKDADGMEVTLKDLGFGVIRGQDLDKRGMRDCVLALKDSIKDVHGRAMVLVYYSGHGIQAGGRNYLIPIGARLPDRPENADDEIFSVNFVMEQLGEVPDRVNLLILDSCRSDPFVKGAGPRWKGRGGAEDTGFANIPAPWGTLIAYAVKPGTAASAVGGDGGTSIYTGKLLGNLKASGASLLDTLVKTGTAVKAATSPTQIPWLEGDVSLLSGIVLKAGLPGLSAASVQPGPPPSPSQQVASVMPPSAVREAETGEPSGVIMLKGRWKEPGSEFRDCPDCPEMVVVPAGSFMMGWSAKESSYYKNPPQHRVTIGRSFAVGKYAVMQGEWESVMGNNPSRFKGPRNPVEIVSWDDAQDFITRLNAKIHGTVLVSTGGTGPYRLLTEAEWEYAARAGTTTQYWWGDAVGRGNANCDGCGSQWDNKRTSPVGSFRPNPWGLYNMTGNVQQWVQDCYVDYAYAPTDGSAATGINACDRVHRGGCWTSFPRYLSSASRDKGPPRYRNGDRGFRLARTLP